jgi:uncharacterized membrane protein YkoI
MRNNLTLSALVAVLLVFVLPPLAASAQDAPACLSQREQRIAKQDGRVIGLAAAMHTARTRVSGILVRARLCRGQDGLVYVLTVLARNGKVARLTVDAVKGTLIGGL